MSFNTNKKNEKTYDLNMLKKQLLSLIDSINKLEPAVNTSAYVNLQEIKKQTTAMIKSIENLNDDCDASIVQMELEQRTLLKQKLSSFTDFFGWSSRIKDDGTILYDD